MSKNRADGGERTLKEIFPGEFFGEVALISGNPRPQSVRVLSDSAKVGLLNKEVFEHLAKTSPQFLLLLLKNTFEKLHWAEEKLEGVYAELHKAEPKKPISNEAQQEPTET